MRLWLVRHAATALPTGVCYGASDIPADPVATVEAARRLGVEPAHCQAFEDADAGLEAIRRAGMRAIDVRPALSAPAVG